MTEPGIDWSATKMIYSAFPQFQARAWTYALLTWALEYQATSKLEYEVICRATIMRVETLKSIIDGVTAEDANNVYPDPTFAGLRPFPPIQKISRWLSLGTKFSARQQHELYLQWPFGNMRCGGSSCPVCWLRCDET